MSKGATVVRAPDLPRLLRYVHETLCQRDRLDPAQSPLRQDVVRRGKRVCGLFLHVEGPRLMRSYALWVGDENRILFYDSAGVRTGEVLLSEAPDPARAAA